MSRAPRITGEECVRALVKSGMTLARIKGSHHILKAGDGRYAIVPCHVGETLGPGILSKILATAQITREDFENLL